MGNVKRAIYQEEEKELLEVRYRWDPFQRLASLRLVSGVSEDRRVNQVRDYAYDGLGRLLAAATRFKEGGSSMERYAYDGNDNLLSRERDGTAQHYRYNDLDQRQEEGVIYDANGRMVEDPRGRRYRYDAFDRLVQVTFPGGKKIDYRYHPDGTLAGRDQGKERMEHYYHGGVIQAVSRREEGAGQPRWSSFLFGDDRRIGSFTDQKPSGRSLHANGSTVLVRDENGFSPVDHDPYGKTDAVPGDAFAWKQEYADPETGLVYLRSRFYNPDLSAFMTMDHRYEHNRYAYGNGDPVNRIDPTGHNPQAWQVAGFAVGFIVGITVSATAGYLIATGMKSLGAGIGLATTANGTTSLTLAGSIGSNAVGNTVGGVVGDYADAYVAGETVNDERFYINLVGSAVGGAYSGVRIFKHEARISGAVEHFFQPKIQTKWLRSSTVWLVKKARLAYPGGLLKFGTKQGLNLGSYALGALGSNTPSPISSPASPHRQDPGGRSAESGENSADGPCHPARLPAWAGSYFYGTSTDGKKLAETFTHPLFGGYGTVPPVRGKS